MKKIAYLFLLYASLSSLFISCKKEIPQGIHITGSGIDTYSGKGIPHCTLNVYETNNASSFLVATYISDANGRFDVFFDGDKSKSYACFIEHPMYLKEKGILSSSVSEGKLYCTKSLYPKAWISIRLKSEQTNIEPIEVYFSVMKPGGNNNPPSLVTHSNDTTIVLEATGAVKNLLEYAIYKGNTRKSNIIDLQCSRFDTLSYELTY